MEKKHIFLITFIAFFSYSNILGNGFVWDDESFISGWEEIRSFENIPGMLMGSVPTGHEGVFRPLRGVFYIFAFHLFGLNPLGYHFFSILIHVLCTIFVYLISKKLIDENTGLISSLLFATHPVHVEAISFITTSFDVIGVIFFLISFYLYISSDGKKSFQLLSIFFGFMAFFTYELTLSLPLLIVLYEIHFNSESWKSIRLFLKQISPYFGILFFYVFIRFFVFEIPRRGFYLANSVYFTVLASLKVLLNYFVLLVFPINLTVNHLLPGNIYSFTLVEYNHQAVISQNIFEIPVLASLFLILILTYFSIKNFRRHPIISFSIGWIFLTLLPVLNIFPHSVLMAEKYLYIPSIGYCIVFSYIFKLFSEKYMHVRKLFFVIFLLFFSSYTFITINRNADWKSHESLWLSTVISSPGSSYAHYNLGVAMRDQGKFREAAYEFKKTLSINPRFYEANYNLGNLYFQIGRKDLAIEEYQKALGVKPNYLDAMINLGLAYQEVGEYDKSLLYYMEAYKLSPSSPELFNNLGSLYLESQEFCKSISSFEKALILRPDYSKAKKNLNVANLEKDKLGVKC